MGFFRILLDDSWPGRNEMNVQAKPQFVQIAVAMAQMQANMIYALDDAGGVWLYRDTKKKWVRVPADREE
jgi:hypothetical protein